MINKRLEPIKRPTTSNINPSQSSIQQCLIELIKQQKITNEILQSQYSKDGVLGSSSYKKQQDSKISQKVRSQVALNHPHSPQPTYQSETTTSQLVKLNDSLQHLSQLLKPHQVHAKKHFSLQLPQSLISQSLHQPLLHQPLLPTSNKKNYHILSQFLPYTDRREYKIHIDFQTFADDFPKNTQLDIKALQQITTEWIGDVFRMVASMCWNMLLNGFLNFDQTKILFTQNIIYNYIQFMNALEKRGYSQHKHYLTSLIDMSSLNVLQFLGKQFPQTKIDAPNIRLIQILPNVNDSSRLKYDLITLANQKSFSIKYNKNGNYAQAIMQLINFLINSTNQLYNQYEKNCFNMFQKVFLLPENRVDNKQTNITPSNQSNQQTNQQQIFQSAQDLMYREKVKRYTNFLIGRKISKNVPTYTREEINNGVFAPKSPAILRIITKWVQQLTQLIKDPYHFIASSDRQLKAHDGTFVVLFAVVRNAVCQKIIQTRDKLFKKVQQIKQQCFLIQSILSSPLYTQDPSQTHLSQDQISVGKFSVNLQKAISSYIYLQLTQLLHFLLGIPSLVDEKAIGISNEFYQSQIRKQLDKLNLVTMKVFDVFRCKFHSNQEQVIWLIKYMIDRNDDRKDQFKLIRVKDRLSQGTRDIMCNVRFKKGGFVSEMQLSVVSNIQKKQQQLDYYNHFLYQLKRSKLGPLSQNVSIWTLLQQRSSYFQSIPSRPIPLEPMLHSCQSSQLFLYTHPISCQSCNNFYPYPQTCFSNVKCKKCNATYCGACYSQQLDERQRKQVIFGKVFKSNVINNIKEHIDHTKPFPLQGFYVKKFHQRTDMSFFTVLIKNIKTQQPVSPGNIEQLVRNGGKGQCQIIFTHNYLAKGKSIQKQKNYKDKIFGKFNQKGQLFIDQKSYKFFRPYLLFYFNQKFQCSILSVQQIEQILKQPHNQKKKVLNLMQQPVYIQSGSFSTKKSQKIREIYYLKQLFPSPQKLLIYQFQRLLIICKLFKDSLQLCDSINYANNIAQLKKYANAQQSIISLEKHNARQQFNLLNHQIGDILFGNIKRNLRKIYINYNALETLQGLKYFIHLEVLYARHNQLKSIQGVQCLEELILIRFDDNKVQSLQPLRNISSIRRIMGIDNKITSIQPLSKLSDLKTLQLQRNPIPSLQPISMLPQLQDINFSTCPSLTILPQFVSTEIKYISLSKTKIIDFSLLIKYINMKKLVLQQCELTKIPQFIKKMKLEELWLGSNKIDKIENLDNQNDLEILSLKGNFIKVIQQIHQLDTIKTIYLDNNQITSLNGIKNCSETLIFFSIKQNPLDDCKQLVYVDQSMTFTYTTTRMTQKGINELNQILYLKVNSSGSDD